MITTRVTCCRSLPPSSSYLAAPASPRLNHVSKLCRQEAEKGSLASRVEPKSTDTRVVFPPPLLHFLAPWLCFVSVLSQRWKVAGRGRMSIDKQLFWISKHILVSTWWYRLYIRLSNTPESMQLSFNLKEEARKHKQICNLVLECAQCFRRPIRAATRLTHL